MSLTAVSRPTKRTCSWLVEDNIPERLSPLFLYDSSVPSSIFDGSNRPATDPNFAGRVRRWNDLSGNNRHLTSAGNFTTNVRDILYDSGTNNEFPLNSSVRGITNGYSGAGGTARRLQLNLATPISNKSFEMFLIDGFTENPPRLSSIFATGSSVQTGASQICFFEEKLQLHSRFNNDGTNAVTIEENFSTGIKNIHIRYDYPARKVSIRLNGNLVAEQNNYIMAFYAFKLFCNRDMFAEAPAEIRYLAIFDGLLTSQQSKDYSLYQNCKWGSV